VAGPCFEAFVIRFPLSLALTLVLPAQTPEPPQSDGPHVFWKGGQAQVVVFRGTEREERPLPPPFRLEVGGPAPLQLDPRAPEPPPAEYPAPSRIAAVSDVHGRLDALLRLLAAHGIVDGARRWTYGTGHLVIDGDVFDKGTQVTGVFWLIRSLEVQAQAAGGRVHLVMGNHESMSLRGNLRSLHPAYQAMGWRPQELFGPEAELGRWLRTRPVLLRLGDTLFVHAGVCPDLLEAELPIAACNARFSRALDRSRKDLLLSKQGPIWYKGLLPLDTGADAEPAQVEALLEAFRVKRVVVGHQVLDRVRAFHGGRVFGIDAGMERGRPGELWIWDGGRPWRGLADGSRVPLDGQ